MSSELDNVRKWLGDCYRPAVLKKNRFVYDETMRHFRKVLAASEDMNFAARQELTRLSGDPALLQRCFISKKHAEFLKAALA